MNASERAARAESLSGPGPGLRDGVDRMDEVPEIKLCEAANELEAQMIVNMFNEEGIPARSDSTQGSTIFGGLPFEPGHQIFVPASQVEKAMKILRAHPHFQHLGQES